MRQNELLVILAAMIASGTNYTAAEAVDRAEAIVAEVERRHPVDSDAPLNAPPAPADTGAEDLARLFPGA